MSIITLAFEAVPQANHPATMSEFLIIIGAVVIAIAAVAALIAWGIPLEEEDGRQ